MTLYDLVPYPPLTHSYTHPDRLAVVARLMGLHAVPTDACSVLELGCGDGANLIAMAELLPESQFVGVDLSQRQIQDGQDIVDNLGMKNLELVAADLLDLPDQYGSFDYVVAHGLYSWVPEPVRRKALDLIKHSLAPQGIAYVSYNAYPGWHQLSTFRDLMLYRTRGISDPIERAQAAREAIAFLAESQTDDGPFASLVQQYYSSFQGRGPVPESMLISTLLHDELSEVNDPIYFSVFVQSASEAGLQFLAEADLEGSTPVDLDSRIVEKLRSFAHDSVEVEQYLDFVRNRGFRRTLLCHQGAPVSRTLKADAEALSGFYVASKAKPERKPGKRPRLQRFLTPSGLAFSSEQPLVQAAFRHLSAIHPDAVTFEDLLSEASLDTYGKPEASQEDADTLASVLLRSYLHSQTLVELYVSPRPVAVRPTSKPRTTAYARLMARSGAETITNARHERVDLRDTARLLVPLLDGEHDIESLTSALVASTPDSGLGSPRALRKSIQDELRWLASASVLVG